MLFDRPASLPVATMRSSSRMATFVSHVRGARSRTWRWSRPRLVPAVVAMIGMLAVLGSAEYLTHLARYTPEQPASVIEPQIASLPAPAPIEYRDHVLAIDHQMPMLLIVDGTPMPIGSVLQLPSSGAPVQIRLVPQR